MMFQFSRKGAKAQKKAKGRRLATGDLPSGRILVDNNFALWRLCVKYYPTRSPLFALFCASLWPISAAAFSFDDIEFWIGEGANRAAFVIDWVEGDTQPPALAWGYRWDGVAKGRDILVTIVAADPRLYAKVGGSLDSLDAVYGLGYDANNNGLFSIDDGTSFDADGFALSGPADLAVSNDPEDYYAEGWFAGFWHYGVETPPGANPYDGANWSDIQVGMASRDLVDSSWDSWAFEGSTTPPFTAFAENPTAAPSPYPQGDLNRNGEVDAADYGVWASKFASTTQPAADANRNGFVDAADYVIWRDHLPTPATATSNHVPEPASASLALLSVLLISAREMSQHRQGRLAPSQRRRLRPVAAGSS